MVPSVAAERAGSAQERSWRSRAGSAGLSSSALRSRPQGHGPGGHAWPRASRRDLAAVVALQAASSGIQERFISRRDLPGRRLVTRSLVRRRWATCHPPCTKSHKGQRATRAEKTRRKPAREGRHKTRRALTCLRLSELR